MDVPKVLIKDLAKDLGVNTEVAEALVRKVIDYLDRPCCWSVGFARLLLDLVADVKVRDVLRGLGIELGDPDLASEGLLRFGRILDTIITYLEKAGIVEYVRSDGVVNLVRR